MEKITLRLATPDDDDFLFRLYAAGREGEFRLAGIDDAQIASLLTMQHAIRKKQYDARYDRSENWIIVLGDCAVGRSLIQRAPDAWILVDLAILPAHQNKGIGTVVLKTQLAEADRAKVIARLHMQIDNPAIRLYRRLGFVVTGSDEFYLEMERPARS